MSNREIPHEHTTPPANGDGVLARTDQVHVHTKAPDLLATLPADVAARAAELMGTRRALATIKEVAQSGDPQKAADIVAKMNPGDFRALVQAGEPKLGELLGKVSPTAFAEKLEGQRDRTVERHLKSADPDYAQAVHDAIQARMEKTQASVDFARQARQMEKADPASAARKIMAGPKPIEQASRLLPEIEPKQAANILVEISNATQSWATAVNIVGHMEIDAVAKIVAAKPEELAIVYRSLHTLTQRVEAGSPEGAREIVPVRSAEVRTAVEAQPSTTIKILERLAEENPKQAARMLEGLNDLAVEALGAIKTSGAVAIIEAGKSERLAPILAEFAEHNRGAVAAILQDVSSKKGAEVARLIDADTLHPVLETMYATERGSLKVAELVAGMAKIEEWKAAGLWDKMKIVWMDNKVNATLVAASTALSSSIDVSQIAVSDHGIANIPFMASALTASVTSLIVGRYGYEQMQKRTIPSGVPHFGGKKLTDSTSLFQISFSVGWGVVSGALQLMFNYFLLGHS